MIFSEKMRITHELAELALELEKCRALMKSNTPRVRDEAMADATEILSILGTIASKGVVSHVN